MELSKFLNGTTFKVATTPHCVGEYVLCIPVFDSFGRKVSQDLCSITDYPVDLLQSYTKNQILNCAELTFGFQLKLIRVVSQC
jgi:hypothetical protein